MPTLTTREWNVVAVGGWNPAILSPSGIAKHIFGLPEGTPVKLELSLDAPSPGKYRVVHEGFRVSPTSTRLVVECERASFTNLRKAAGLISRACEELPVTPISAVGINTRFHLADAEAGSLVTSSPIDDRLSDAGFPIKKRHVIRSLGFDPGAINLSIQVSEPTEYDIEFNFDCRGERAQMIDWLAISEEQMKTTISKVLMATFSVELPEELV